MLKLPSKCFSKSTPKTLYFLTYRKMCQPDFFILTIAQLKKECRKREMINYSKLKKLDLIEELLIYDQAMGEVCLEKELDEIDEIYKELIEGDAEPDYGYEEEKEKELEKLGRKRFLSFARSKAMIGTTLNLLGIPFQKVVN